MDGIMQKLTLQEIHNHSLYAGHVVDTGLQLVGPLPNAARGSIVKPELRVSVKEGQGRGQRSKATRSSSDHALRVLTTGRDCGGCI